jgi:DNA-binding NtrC family response regulator
VSNILILEDEAGFQALLAEVLGSAGHRVTAAATGPAALALASEEDFDLLLVDQRVPGFSGLEFLKHYRSHHPHTPVIMMTAYAEVPVVVESMRLGAVDFLVKPFSLEVVLPLVERCLERAADARPGGAPPGQPV